jgi:hypothetical protein
MALLSLFSNRTMKMWLKFGSVVAWLVDVTSGVDEIVGNGVAVAAGMLSAEGAGLTVDVGLRVGPGTTVEVGSIDRGEKQPTAKIAEASSTITQQEVRLIDRMNQFNRL